MIWKQRHSAPRERTTTIEPVTGFAEPPDDAQEPEVMDRLVRVNVKLLLVTLTILIVSAVGIHFVHGYWIQRNADVLLERADAAEEDERYSDAISSLTQYLNLQPQVSLSESEDQQITDILERLARLFQMQKTSRNQQLRLYRTYEDVLRRDPTRDKTRRQLVDVCMQLGLFRDAIRHIDTLLERPEQHATDPLEGKAELYSLKGDCHRALEEYRTSALAYVHAIATEPANPEHYVRAAALAVAQPGEMPTRDHLNRQLKGIAGPFVLEVTDAFHKSPGSSRRRGMQTAIDLLDLMTTHAEPAWQSQLLKSEFLLGISSREDSLGVDPEVAATRADAMLVERDSNEDGTLDAAEADHETVPVLADADGDGLLDRTELVDALARGDRRARLDVALESARQAIDLAEKLESPRALARTLRNAADVNIALANVMQFEPGADPAAYRSTAREYLERGLKTGYPDPRIHLSLARLERQQLSSTNSEDEISTRLQRSQEHLRNGLELVNELPETGTEENEDEEEQDDRRPEAIEAELLWNLADTLVATYQLAGKQEALLAEVRGLIPRLQEIGAREQVTQFLEAQILIAEEQWRSALRLLTPLSTMNLDDALDKRIAVLRARCLQELEIPDSVVSLFADRIQRDPLWTEGRTQLARAMVEVGQVQRAIDEYRRIVTAPGVADALARLLLVQQSSLPADRRDFGEIETVVGLIPSDSSPTRAVLEAELAVLQASTLMELAQGAPAQEAMEEQSVKMLDAARDTLQDAIDNWPKDADVRAAFATLMLRRFDMPGGERLAAAQSYLQNAVEELGDQVEFRLAASQAAVYLPKDDAIASLDELQSDLDKFKEAEQIELLSGLARAYATVGDFDQAIELWRKVADAQPNALEPRLTVLRLMIAAWQSNNIDLQIDEGIWDRTLAEARTIEAAIAPDGEQKATSPVETTSPNAAYFEAARLIIDAAKLESGQEAQLKQAQTLLERARRNRPMWSAIPRALGDIEVLRGNRELAVAHYEKAFAMGDRTPRMIGRIAQHHFSQMTSDGIERAGRLMEEVRAENPNLISGDLAQLQWRISWRQAQFNDALDVLEELAARTGSLEDRLRWLWAQLLTGQRSDDIEQLLEELAEEHGSKSPEVWRVWVAYLVQAGRNDEALGVIEQAKKELPDDPPHVRPLAIAGYIELLRASDQETLTQYRAEVERYYRLALEAAPDSTTVAIPMARYYIATQQHDQARSLLEAILDPASDAPELAREWARRNKAVIIASSGRYDDTTRALELLDSVADEDASANDLRTRLAILARRGTPSERQERLDILDAIEARTDLTNAELLQRAQLFDATGDWPAAKDLYTKLARNAPDNAFIRARFAEALIRHEELQQSEEVIAEMQRIVPDSFAVVLLQTRLLAARDQQDQAVSLIRGFLEKQAEVDSPDELLRDLLLQGNVSQAMDELQRIATSEKDQAADASLAEARKQLQAGNSDAALRTIALYFANSARQFTVRSLYYKSAARLLGELELYAEAESIYRDYLTLSKTPEDHLGLATYVVRQGRVDEALEICEAAWEDCSPTAVANASVAILRETRTESAEHIEQVESRLKDAIRQHGGENPAVAAQIMFHLADLRDLQQRYDAAIELYEGILRLAPQHLAARNNLAWMLAMKNRDLDRALELLQAAIDRIGPQSVLVDTRGAVHLARGDVKAAARDFKIAAAAANDPTIRFHQAVAALAAGSQTESRRHYAAAVEAGFSPDSLHALERQVYAQQLKKLEQEHLPLGMPEQAGASDTD